MYTHTIFMDINSVRIEGELDFGETQIRPRLKTESDLDIPLDELRLVYEFLELMTTIFTACHRKITKIEIAEKV